MIYKATPAHFAFYKQEVRYWLDRFGMKDWEISFEMIIDSQNNALLTHDALSRTAEFGFGDNQRVAEGLSLENDISNSAFHEVAELLTSRLYMLARKRTWDLEEWQSEVHVIVHRLMNTFWSPCQSGYLTFKMAEQNCADSITAPPATPGN